MLCSKCSEPVTPIVALDIDGTLGDYHTHLLEFMRGYVGRDLPSGWTGSPESWEEYLGVTQERYREMKLAFRQGGMKRTMPVFPFASEMTKRLRVSLGVEVWITTTRPWQRLDSVDPDTREWLARNEIAYDHLLYDEHKYKRLAEMVDPQRVVFILDDLAEMFDEAETVFGEGVPYLIERPHNRATHRRRSVPSLSDAYEIMQLKIQRWRSEHE